MPGKGTESTGIDVTQAYQTVQARLTQAVAQTPTLTLSPPPGDETPIATLDGNTTTATIASTVLNEPSATRAPATRCDQAAAAYPKIDITIEDDTEMAPGEAFTKIWRVVNVGTCSWTPDYAIVFFSGEQMEAQPSQPLGVTVPPNQSVDLSVDMVAPGISGTYQSNWKLRSVDDALFGIGPSGESPFWVRIKVVSVATKTPAPSPTLTPTTPIQANGPVTLVLTDTLDLDSLLVNGGGADLMYTTATSDPSQHQLSPFGSAEMGIWGITQPALTDCQTANLTGSPIVLNELAVGTYICFETDLGLPGWARMDSFDAAVGTVTLQVLTWKLP